MEMKPIRISIFCLAVLLLVAPMLRAQDFSKYRHFTIGMSLTRVVERTDQKIADVKVIHERPALIQELTWWPPKLPGNSYQADSVQQMLFSFYNGELYRITVIYDRTSTEGLTADDMVRSISTKYGPATFVDLAIDFTPGQKEEPVASWNDSQFSSNLVRSSFSGGFELVICSKKISAEAELAFAEAVKLDKQEGPQREIDRQKKETDALEVTRQKNQKSFRP
jgi:hypothetical protein